MKNRKTMVAAIIFALVFLFTSVGMQEGTVASAATGKAAINVTNLVMREGQTKNLKISGTKKRVTWKSSKKSVAKVSSNGKVTAVKSGTASITGTVGSKKYTCQVRVNAKKNGNRVLIAYFSQTGTTKSVATKIQKLTGGDIIRIREKNRYPNDYDKTVARAQRELDKDARPAITSTVMNMKDYDVVYIGYPIWWHSTPKVIDTFLEKYNFNGKTVIPFCTSGGSDISESMDVIQELCKGADILEGYTADSGSSREIQSWLEKIGMLEGDTGSADQPDTSSGGNGDPNGGKNLVVYFSRSGNTETMANQIHDRVGGDLLKIEPLNPYPSDYTECANVAKTERDNNERPAIANLPASLEEYDNIFVGYPIWWHTAPMIIGTFLENYDLTGKNIYPFSQSASMDTEQFGNSMDFVRASASGAVVHEGLFVQASDTEAINSYLRQNGF